MACRVPAFLNFFWIRRKIIFCTVKFYLHSLTTNRTRISKHLNTGSWLLFIVMRSTLDFERGPRLSVSSINNCISGSIHSFTVPTSVSSSSYKHTPLDLKLPLLSVQRASSVGFFYNTFRLKRSANSIDSNGLTEKDLQPLPGYMYIIYFFTVIFGVKYISCFIKWLWCL